jgi:hypothetical protein
VRPPRRGEALGRIAELGGDLILFNPEPGTSQVAESPSPTRPILTFLEARGYDVDARKFVAPTPGGDYVMRLIVAVAPSRSGAGGRS